MRRPETKAKPARTSTAAPDMARSRFPAWLPPVLLALVTLALYWPITRFDFVNYDDPLYVTENPHVQAGLTWEGLVWAFGRVHGEGTYWHPLTWVSHMLDCQLYGLRPWGHHLTSVLLHAANAVLVFLVFRRMTGALWRSVVLAGIFALHPLQVDTVAWVTERKNLLSALFWLLTTWAYVCYVKGATQRPGSSSTQRSTSPSPSSLYYAMSLVLFALGLMCKPILVTLPFVLLLLDYWPLQRLQVSTLTSQASTIWRLLREKVPFFVLAAASSAITILAHRGLGMLDAASRLPFGLRLENAVVSYGRYLAKTLWPCRLAVFYPFPAAWPIWAMLVCSLLMLAITGAVLGTARRRPWLVVGWFWVLGVLVPSSGLIQAGTQAMADRFMYVPVIGVIISVVWGIHGLAKGGRDQQIVLSVAGLAALVVCAILTRQQLGYWKNSETLFRHALGVTENNFVAHNNLGIILGQRGLLDEAIGHYLEAIRLNPDHPGTHNNLGIALENKDRTDEAIGQYQEAIRLKPDYSDAHNNLGSALLKKGQTEEAIRQFQEAIRLKPDHLAACYNLGIALDKKGRTDEAIRQYQETLRLKPDFADAYYSLGNAFNEKGQTDEAMSQYEQALRLKPQFAEAHYSLGILLDQKGRTDEAMNQFKETINLKPDHADAHNNLGVALGKKGQIDAAISQIQETIRLKPDHAEAHNNLGTAFLRQGRTDDAMTQYREALRLKPDYAEASRNLDVALATKASSAPPVGASTNR